MNFLKSLVGTGIYSMPLAFSHVGLLTGIFATVFTALICSHCVFMLLQSTTKLCRRMRKPSMSFPEVAEAACTIGEFDKQRVCGNG